MASRRRPPSPPPARFTKSEVNRAGDLLLDLRERILRDGEERAALELGGNERLEEAWESLTWWRGLHARPLSTVAANLRYHVGREDGGIEGRIEVTQRLKRLTTLIDKLARLDRGELTEEELRAALKGVP